MALPSPTIHRLPNAREAWSRREAEREVDALLRGEEYRWSTPEEAGAVWDGERWRSRWESMTYASKPPPPLPTTPNPSSPVK